MTATDHEILNYAIENGIIDPDTIQRKIEMQKKQDILSKHKHKIRKGKNGRWITYLPCEKKGRKLVSKKTKEELEDAIVSHYQEIVMKPCFREVYEEWILEKESFHELSPSSLCRYRNDFMRFFPENEDFCKIKLCNMTESILERFIKKAICEKQLSAKSYAGLRTLLIGVFKYAKREKYTDFNITTFFNELSLPNNIFKKSIKNNEEEVFSISELHLLVTYMNEHPTTKNLGLLLQIYTGIRVGELSSLKPVDNIKKCYLRICRTEYKYYDNELQMSQIGVKEFPKTENSIRDILLPEKAQDILDHLKSQAGNNEYLLSENGKRITSRQLNYQLEAVCKKIGIPPRSTHKIRRSYASKLLSENVDTAIIQNQLGHKQISTTQTYYHYEISSDSSKHDEINRAINF